MPSTVYLVSLVTDACKEWVDENVDQPEWFGKALIVAHHYLESLLMGLQEAGFAYRIDFEVMD